MPTRSATTADHRAFYGKEPPKTWLGGVAENDGAIVAFSGVVWESGHYPVAFFDRRGDVRPVTMHRTVLKWLDALRWAGEDIILVKCDRAIPNAEKWLRRLGFEPVENDIWKLRLADVRL